MKKILIPVISGLIATSFFVVTYSVLQNKIDALEMKVRTLWNIGDRKESGIVFIGVKYVWDGFGDKSWTGNLSKSDFLNSDNEEVADLSKRFWIPETSLCFVSLPSGYEYRGNDSLLSPGSYGMEGWIGYSDGFGLTKGVRTDGEGVLDNLNFSLFGTKLKISRIVKEQRRGIETVSYRGLTDDELKRLWFSAVIECHLKPVIKD